MKKAQSLLEYILIFSVVAMAGYVISSKMDFKALRNYVFVRPADSTTGVIKIEAMTK